MFLLAAPQLIYGTKIDYLVFDYLSEITMSLLIAAKHKQKVSICSYAAFSAFTAYTKVHLTRSMNQFKLEMQSTIWIITVRWYLTIYCVVDF